MKQGLEQFLMALLSQPTAPFREQRVITLVTGLLDKAGAPFFQDTLGNVVVGASSRTDYLRLLREPKKEPVRVFIAHMDHPGFHGVRWIKPDVLRVQWHGGSPTRHLQGSSVWLADDKGFEGDGVLRSAKLRKDGWAIDTAEVHLKPALPSPRPLAKSLYGGFSFRKPVWKSGSRLYTQAADDLIGVFCLVATALAVFGKRNAKSRPPFIGLLTRAEEVGLVGATGHFELGWLQQARRPVVCVSLEASRALPGAEVGKGPIVRLGDLKTTFDPAYSQVLTELAGQVLPNQHQRRIMDGGRCEGTAATAYGFPTIALAVPLGNYHNQGLEGGPDCRGHLGPAPEFVHLDDIKGQFRLCEALMGETLLWDDPWHSVRAKLAENQLRYRDAL
jgi:putative aminopeptidase FrvX